MNKTSNHYITVSRTGELWARRKGHAPVLIATAEAGLDVTTDDDARTRGAPASVRVRFAHGGQNRELRVMAVEVDGVALDPDAFLARFEVSEKALGRWLRAAVDEALDRAERSQS